jgi:hypothetical protein
MGSLPAFHIGTPTAEGAWSELVGPPVSLTPGTDVYRDLAKQVLKLHVTVRLYLCPIVFKSIIITGDWSFEHGLRRWVCKPIITRELHIVMKIKQYTKLL